jgi:hypothetical protein
MLAVCDPLSVDVKMNVLTYVSLIVEHIFAQLRGIGEHDFECPRHGVGDNIALRTGEVTLQVRCEHDARHIS